MTGSTGSGSRAERTDVLCAAAPGFEFLEKVLDSLPWRQNLRPWNRLASRKGISRTASFPNPDESPLPYQTVENG
jgi:hypothetical protein